MSRCIHEYIVFCSVGKCRDGCIAPHGRNVQSPLENVLWVNMHVRILNSAYGHARESIWESQRCRRVSQNVGNTVSPWKLVHIKYSGDS